MNRNNSALSQWQAGLIDLAQNGPDSPNLPSIRSMPGMDKRKITYRNNYQLTLLDGLTTAYPMVHQLVGEKYFELLANSYIQQQPLSTSNQSKFGANFSHHIQELAAHKKELFELPYLVDIAKADWMLNRVYYVKNSREFDIEAFSNLDDTEQLQATLQLAEDVFLLDSQWPIDDMWAFHQKKTTLHQIHQSGEHHHFLITRNDQQPVVIKIGELERSVLQCVIEGYSIATMPNNLSLWIAPCIKNGWISGFVVP